MELKELATLYRRWIWLLFVGMVLGLGSGFIVSKIQAPIYEASTKVLITRSRQQGSTDLLAINDQQLVLTYQQLLKTRPVLDEAGSRLGFNINPDNVKVEVIADTQILQIKVQDNNPEQAAAIANGMVQILVEQNETLQATRFTVYEESLNAQAVRAQTQIDKLQAQITQINQASIEEQLELVNKQIADLQDEISNLEGDIAAFPSSLTAADRAGLTEKQAQLDSLRSLLYLYQQIQTNLTYIGKPMQGGTGVGDPRVASLQGTLNLYQQLYLDLLNNLETVKLARVQSTPTVNQIEEAAIPGKPIRPIPLLYTVLSGMVGLFIAAGAILLMDYFDDTLKSARKVQEVLGLPVIGEITEASPPNNGRGFYAANHVNSSVLNAFGILRINVARLAAQNSVKTILITSPALAEGKTTIAMNLAAAFAHAGRNVFLMDADPYHPSLHSQLGLDNQIGLTDILAGKLHWQDATHDFGGITIMTSGARTSSSAILLESDYMTQLLAQLQKRFDLIIIDGPPLFVVDSQVLASKVGGILLVVRLGGTITAVARALLDQLNLTGANLLGVVLNRVPRADAYYYGGYYSDNHQSGLDEKLEEIQAKQN